MDSRFGLMCTMSEGSFEGRAMTYGDLKALARTCEQVGLDNLWLADHLIFRSAERGERGTWEVFTMLGALAAVTERLALGPLVACTQFREPALLAKMVDTLDAISQGRMTLGLGAGWNQPEFDAFGFPFDHRVDRFEEALQVIIPLLREGRVTFRGRHYDVQDCVLRPRGPRPGGPPIWIGAGGPRMLRLAARYGDAWNSVWHSTVDEVRAERARLQEACAEVGRDPATIDFTAGVVVGLSPRERPAGATQPIGGTPEEVAATLKEIVGLGASHVVIWLDPFTMADVEKLGRVVELARAGEA
jgi:probable F420-dependent oxidoreductase